MNDYFCVAPFYATEYQINQVTPCCLLPNNHDINRIRTNMLEGRRTPDCQVCWHLEDQSVKSERQIKNETFDVYADKDIKFVEEDCRAGLNSEQIVKLNTSTLCNSTCVTCKEFHVSSSWETILFKNNKKVSVPVSKLQNIDYKNLKIFSLLGGEPLFEKENFNFLSKLIDAGNTNCFISIVTNGSVELSQQQINILKEFKNLNFCLSIDGIGPVFEYMRYPLKWKILLSNIELFRSLDINLSVSYTISNLNIIYYKETIEWFNAQKLNYNHRLVDYPKYFSPNSLPLGIKEQLPDVSHLFSPHVEQDDINFKLMLDDIKLQDQLKGISINDYLPKLVALLKTS